MERDQFGRTQLDKIEGKIDHAHERLSSIDVTLIEQAHQLKEHMRRTKAAEQTLAHQRDILERALVSMKDSLDTAIKPLQTHVTKTQMVIQIGAWTAAAVAFLVSLAAGIVKIIEFVQH